MLSSLWTTRAWWVKCMCCTMQMSYLYASDMPFKTLFIPGIWPVLGLVIVKKQIEVSFLCVCPLIEEKGLNFFQALILQLLKLCVYLRWSIMSSYLSPHFKHMFFHIFICKWSTVGQQFTGTNSWELLFTLSLKSITIMVLSLSRNSFHQQTF